MMLMMCIQIRYRYNRKQKDFNIDKQIKIKLISTKIIIIIN